MFRYLVVVNQIGSSYSAYAPDLPGCVAAGNTVDETLRLMQEAMVLHLSAMQRDGDEIPEDDSAAVAAFFITVDTETSATNAVGVHAA